MFRSSRIAIVWPTIVATIWTAIKAFRAGGLPTSEEEDVPSRIFAPKGFLPTPAEKEVYAEWKAAGLDPSPQGVHH